jgi:hypothetical protein
VGRALGNQAWRSTEVEPEVGGDFAMSRTISEPDWKVFRQLQPLALERYCERVLTEIKQIAADSKKTSHERYLATYKLLQRRDRELADAFDDLRRSTALRQLACLQSHELLTDEEMARFSSETREVVRFFLGPQES